MRLAIANCWVTFIYVDNIPLSVVSKRKYLGLMLDDDLFGYHQVSKVCQSMSYYLHLYKLIFKKEFVKATHLKFCLLSCI